MHYIQFFLLQVGNLFLRCGEYLLDLLDIHVPKDTLDLILVLMQVYGSHMQEFRNIPQIALLTEKSCCMSSGTLNCGRKFLTTFP